MDYNIYLHSVELSEPTMPWQSQETSESQGFQISKTTKSEANNTPNGLSAINKNIKNFASNHPVGTTLAVTIAVIKACDKVVDYTTSFMASENGNYAFRYEYENFKASVRTITHPISAALNFQKQKQAERLHSQRVEQERILFGDLNINNGNFYGV